jgi:hypothetical protein
MSTYARAGGYRTPRSIRQLVGVETYGLELSLLHEFFSRRDLSSYCTVLAWYLMSVCRLSMKECG